VLDVGCGTGRNAVALLSILGPAAVALGVDNRRSIVQRFVKFAARQGLRQGEAPDCSPPAASPTAAASAWVDVPLLQSWAQNGWMQASLPPPAAVSDRVLGVTADIVKFLRTFQPNAAASEPESSTAAAALDPFPFDVILLLRFMHKPAITQLGTLIARQLRTREQYTAPAATAALPPAGSVSVLPARRRRSVDKYDCGGAEEADNDHAAHADTATATAGSSTGETGARAGALPPAVRGAVVWVALEAFHVSAPHPKDPGQLIELGECRELLMKGTAEDDAAIGAAGAGAVEWTTEYETIGPAEDGRPLLRVVLAASLVRPPDAVPI
jgi:hypothetical protein